MLLCMGTLCNSVFFYFDKALQLVCLIAGMMDLIRFVMLLCMDNCVFFYFDTPLKLVCLIAGVMDLIRFVVLLCIS